MEHCILSMVYPLSVAYNLPAAPTNMAEVLIISSVNAIKLSFGLRVLEERAELRRRKGKISVPDENWPRRHF